MRYPIFLIFLAVLVACEPPTTFVVGGPGAKVCDENGCRCPSDEFTDCGDDVECFDISNSLAHCGQCGRDVFAIGGNACTAGEPQCTSSTDLCTNSLYCAAETGCIEPPVENCDVRIPHREACGPETFCRLSADETALDCVELVCDGSDDACDVEGFHCVEGLCRCQPTGDEVCN